MTRWQLFADSCQHGIITNHSDMPPPACTWTTTPPLSLMKRLLSTFGCPTQLVSYAYHELVQSRLRFHYNHFAYRTRHVWHPYPPTRLPRR